MTPAGSDVVVAGSSGARWVSLGRGKFHLMADGATSTVCGREVPKDARTALYSVSGCARCIKAAPDLEELAERSRKALFALYQEGRSDSLERNRRGEFTVYRCRKCGRQHRGHDRNRPGVPFCLDEGHEADLEAITARGEQWTP